MAAMVRGCFRILRNLILDYPSEGTYILSIRIGPVGGGGMISGLIVIVAVPNPVWAEPLVAEIVRTYSPTTMAAEAIFRSPVFRSIEK